MTAKDAEILCHVFVKSYVGTSIKCNDTGGERAVSRATEQVFRHVLGILKTPRRQVTPCNLGVFWLIRSDLMYADYSFVAVIEVNAEEHV